MKRRRHHPLMASHRGACILMVVFLGAVSVTNIWLFEWTSSPLASVGLSPRTSLLDFHSDSNSKSRRNTQNHFHKSKCWESWKQLQEDTSVGSQVWKSMEPSVYDAQDPTVVWTVSGGDEYRESLPMLLTHWKEIFRKDPVVLLVVALDRETFETVCNIEGISVVNWNIPAQSYSRVADAKLGVAAYFSQQELYQLFLELDVFCRVSPLGISQMALGEADLAIPGHGDFQSKINIGLYYVKPSQEASKFFQIVMEILRPSITEKQHLMPDGTKLSYFDQGLLQSCLQMNDNPSQIYAVSDTNHTTNLFYRPPTVYDSTICVHPLAGQPFSSFETKRATAKFLGFDPIDALLEETRPLLKTVSGDLTITDSPDSLKFFGGDFHKSEILERTLQYPLAAVIHFSLSTNRTLVLPRHVRNTNTKAFPLYSLLNTASLEAMGVSWRYLSIVESRQLEVKTQVVSVRELQSIEEASLAITKACQGGNEEQRSGMSPTKRPICSLYGVETLISSLYLTGSGSDWKQSLDPIIKKITWCLTPPTGPLFSFSLGAGHMERPCLG
ncbi:hypothetical protein IV203_024355 [Nitzschia inconspicua]|uniref:Uncharacterized protein n=1 Tax=Nitzschia inconspicua TaxID=303405 RepID=A0A9K3PAV5_9STRA|nr:hypothetical protein IV203_024355 [Nitzschia inconspicua]